MEEIAGQDYADAHNESPLRLVVSDNDALGEAPPDAPRKLDLSCTRCGYGVLRSTPPERCPMCQAENAWSRSLPGAHPSTPALTLA
jgi:rubrerythrin